MLVTIDIAAKERLLEVDIAPQVKSLKINIKLNSDNDSLKNLTIRDFKLITNTLRNEPFRKGIENLDLATALTIEGYTPEVHNTLLLYLNEMEDYYNNAYILALRKKETIASCNRSTGGSTQKW